jgi:hypothetical protein
MIYLVIGAAVVAILVWVGRGRLPVPTLRMATAGLALAAAAGSVFAGLRGQWVGGGVLAALALYLGNSARAPRPLASGAMSLSQARSLLGVGPEANADEIKRAYHRLMLRAHPDQGGSDGLAAQLNAARDRLLGA